MDAVLGFFGSGGNIRLVELVWLEECWFRSWNWETDSECRGWSRPKIFSIPAWKNWSPALHDLFENVPNVQFQIIQVFSFEFRQIKKRIVSEKKKKKKKKKFLDLRSSLPRAWFWPLVKRISQSLTNRTSPSNLEKRTSSTNSEIRPDSNSLQRTASRLSSRARSFRTIENYIFGITLKNQIKDLNLPTWQWASDRNCWSKQPTDLFCWWNSQPVSGWILPPLLATSTANDANVASSRSPKVKYCVLNSIFTVNIN